MHIVRHAELIADNEGMEVRILELFCKPLFIHNPATATPQRHTKV